MANQFPRVVLGGLRLVRENLAHKKGFDDAVEGRPKDFWYLKSRSTFAEGYKEVEAYNAGYAEGKHERTARVLESG